MWGIMSPQAQEFWKKHAWWFISLSEKDQNIIIAVMKLMIRE